MKSIPKILATLVALSTLNLIADTVDPGQIVTFKAGAPATAADMNQTIQALVTAINDNAAKLSPSLNDSSWKIIIQTIGLGAEKEFQSIADPDPINDGNVVGHTIVSVGHVLRYTELTVTLASGGTFSGTYTDTEREVNLIDTAPHYDYSPSNPVASNGIQPYQDETPDSDTISGTWSLSGSTLSITIPDPIDGDETLNFTLSASADVLVSIGGSLETSGGPELRTSTMMIGVRTTTAP